MSATHCRNEQRSRSYDKHIAEPTDEYASMSCIDLFDAVARNNLDPHTLCAPEMPSYRHMVLVPLKTGNTQATVGNIDMRGRQRSLLVPDTTNQTWADVNLCYGFTVRCALTCALGAVSPEPVRASGQWYTPNPESANQPRPRRVMKKGGASRVYRGHTNPHHPHTSDLMN